MEIDNNVVKELKARNKRGRGTSASPMSSPPNKKDFIQPESDALPSLALEEEKNRWQAKIRGRGIFA